MTDDDSVCLRKPNQWDIQVWLEIQKLLLPKNMHATQFWTSFNVSFDPSLVFADFWGLTLPRVPPKTSLQLAVQDIFAKKSELLKAAGGNVTMTWPDGFVRTIGFLRRQCDIFLTCTRNQATNVRQLSTIWPTYIQQYPTVVQLDQTTSRP